MTGFRFLVYLVIVSSSETVTFLVSVAWLARLTRNCPYLITTKTTMKVAIVISKFATIPMIEFRPFAMWKLLLNKFKAVAEITNGKVKAPKLG